ncbi:MAG TPA: hypothetical protein VGK36_15780 [Candidatus Angelobacter sp.]|jgi:hypothetical protein
MNNSSCCTGTASTARNTSIKAADDRSHPSPTKRHRLTLAKFSLPTLILVLLPKCPACFAAYMALGMGISVSVASASLLRNLLIVLCVASVVWIFASAFRSAPMNRLHPDSRLY